MAVHKIYIVCIWWIVAQQWISGHFRLKALCTSLSKGYISHYIGECSLQCSKQYVEMLDIPDFTCSLQAHIFALGWVLNLLDCIAHFKYCTMCATLIHFYRLYIHTIHVLSMLQKAMSGIKRPEYTQLACQWAKRSKQTLVTAIPPQVQLIPTRFLHILVALTDLYPLV